MKTYNAEHLAEAKARISRQIIIDDRGCWVWTGNKVKKRKINGRYFLDYGLLKFLGQRWLAHRLSWYANKGFLPPGKMVCHHCDNPPCVNPEHLFIGTCKDNASDCSRKGRTPFGMKHPSSKLTDSLVVKIRKEYKPWDRSASMTVLARRYKLAVGLISDVIHRKRWGHVT